MEILQALVEGVTMLVGGVAGDNKPLSKEYKVVRWLLLVIFVVGLFLFTLKMSE